MKHPVKQTVCVLCCLVLSAFLPSLAFGQGGVLPVKIGLVASGDTYRSEPVEPVKLQIRVFNDSGAPVITRRGFVDQQFHLMVEFTDPDGRLIRSRFFNVSEEPGPPFRLLDADAALVEVVPPVADPVDPDDPNSKIVVVEDARLLYDLQKYGRYTAQVFSAFEKFSCARLLGDPQSCQPLAPVPAGNLAALLSDRTVTDTIASNKISFEILPPGGVVSPTESIRANVVLMKIGTGTKPPTMKEPLGNAALHLIKRSAAVEAGITPINFKTYALIWALPPFRTALTAGDGALKGWATFENVPRDDYIVIAEYLSADGPDARFAGGVVAAAEWDGDPLSFIERHLHIMQKADGKKVPARVTKVTGSELIISEPEVTVWDGTSELYPFVFETEGDWSVITTVVPPEGFVTDHSSLKIEVLNDQKAVQFTITDVGSRWEETDVTFLLKHNGKTEKIKSKVGVKLSRELAGKKGLGIYGHTKSPGKFVDGRRVGK